jgi:hypothetical protein
MRKEKIKFEEQSSKPFILKRTKRGGLRVFDVMVLDENKAEGEIYIKIKGGECKWESKEEVRYNKKDGSSWHKCHVCGKIFEITSDERQWFVDKGLRTPAHCKACRDTKKEIGYYKDRMDNIEAQKRVLHHPFKVRPDSDRRIKR